MGCGSSKSDTPLEQAVGGSSSNRRFVNVEGKDGVLGEGASCYVQKVRDTKNNRECACKYMVKGKRSSDGKDGDQLKPLWEAEVDLLTKFTYHDNILEYIAHGVDDKHYYIVTQLSVGKELFDRITESDSGNFTEKIASYYSRMLVSGLAYLHSINVVHRDLKPENCIFDNHEAESNMRVIDFGCAKQVDDEEMIDDTCGSEYYIAPECIPTNQVTDAHHKHCDPRSNDRKYRQRPGKMWKAADMWSVGIIIYIMLTGEPPFAASDKYSAYYYICDAERNRHQWPQGSKISDSAKDLINRLLSFKWEDRPTAEEVLQHPWIRGESASDDVIGGNMIAALTEFQTQNRLKKAIAKALRNKMGEKDKLEVKKLFDMFDVNKDGRLSADEISAMMNYLGKSKAEAEALILEADDDGDGGLDMDEMMALRATGENGLFEEKNLKNIFQTIDQSGDGLIDSLELAALCKITTAQAAELIAEADDSGDGQIDLEEFLKVMGRMK